MEGCWGEGVGGGLGMYGWEWLGGGIEGEEWYKARRLFLF